ncbi:hypothetical protein ACIQJT_23835 [Streptomyces sp. NPDC091972]
MRRVVEREPGTAVTGLVPAGVFHADPMVIYDHPPSPTGSMDSPW